MSLQSRQRMTTLRWQVLRIGRGSPARKGEALGDLGPFDAAFAFECLHDMPRPVEVLAAIHGAVRPDGLVVIMDEAVADSSRPAIWWSRRCMDTAR